MTESETILNVHSIESFGTHDGPGIRLVVFLQGCNLKCKYCQNPDTIPLQKGIHTPITDLVKRAIKMKSYFADDGGVTVSGGEPMLQSDALVEFFDLLHQEGIHTTVDTNGVVRSKCALTLISETADLIMFDVKGTTEEEFKNITYRKGLQKLLANIELREQSQKPYWLRYVLVPGYTDAPSSVQWLIGNFASNKFLERFEILPYHKLGAYKWEALDMKYEFENVKENTEEQKQAVYQKLKPYFKDVILK